MVLEALLIDDDRACLAALAEVVAPEGFSPVTVTTLGEARRALVKYPPDVVLCDLLLPDGRGTELLQERLAAPVSPEVILITGHATVETAIEAMQLGAFDYLTKPIDISRLKDLLARVRRTAELKRELAAMHGELERRGRFGAMIGVSPAMQEVYDLIGKVAPTSAPVLLVGESGTGKELAAQALHQLSRRARGPFVPLNCGAVAPGLMESELFGHERGSFTGAARQHKGLFERAGGGTLFLDEITEMPLELQVKLLRVLESGQLRRVGGDGSIELDVRVIAATNREPAEAISDRRLREDLYYRLNVFPIQMPPLRDRGGDIELLAVEFLDALNRREGTDKRFDPAALRSLGAYHWPGNVRELKNVVERSFIVAGETIEVGSLSAELSVEAAPAGPYLRLPVGSSLADLEKRLILATVARFDGDKKAAAAALGICLKTLYNRLNSYRPAAG